MSIQFIQWTQETHISLENKGNYSCVYIDGSTKSTVYAYQHINMLKSNCMSNIWLVFSLSLSGSFIIIIIGSFIGFKYRITLQYWYLNIRRKYRHYSRLDGDSKEYKYSAFVAYHNSDYKWTTLLISGKGKEPCIMSPSQRLSSWKLYSWQYM